MFHKEGHSISRPFISKIADFLLHLRTRKRLSLAAIAGYRSMLSAVFKYILPDISSHFVLRDLLRLFAIERLMIPSRAPPWVEGVRRT